MTNRHAVDSKIACPTGKLSWTHRRRWRARHFTKYTVLIPVKGKGLVDSSTRQTTGYTGKAAAWTAEILAYKLYKRVFAIFGLPLQIRSDEQVSRWIDRLTSCEFVS
eukprot:SAG31_NODE_13449_length_868_cov_2.310793_1_plen_107_part_00